MPFEELLPSPSLFVGVSQQFRERNAIHHRLVTVSRADDTGVTKERS